mmetsp:Transcript_44160/g.110895  ORF Transcript_44160/g.110895 Transcript_44160/m.110895 type:complete len:282 (+) Transcript_44160:1354-2199(+)
MLGVVAEGLASPRPNPVIVSSLGIDGQRRGGEVDSEGHGRHAVGGDIFGVGQRRRGFVVGHDVTLAFRVEVHCRHSTGLADHCHAAGHAGHALRGVKPDADPAGGGHLGAKRYRVGGRVVGPHQLADAGYVEAALELGGHARHGEQAGGAGRIGLRHRGGRRLHGHLRHQLRVARRSDGRHRLVAALLYQPPAQLLVRVALVVHDVGRARVWCPAQLKRVAGSAVRGGAASEDGLLRIGGAAVDVVRDVERVGGAGGHVEDELLPRLKHDHRCLQPVHAVA